MATSVVKVDFDNADEHRAPDKTSVDVVNTPKGTVARFTLEPGWTWEECIKPVVGGDSCRVSHLGMVKSGSIKITTDDGEEMTFEAGDVYSLEPGHLAEVVGDEPFVGIEFENEAAQEYARSEAE
jgi:hypothetical protein